MNTLKFFAFAFGFLATISLSQSYSFCDPSAPELISTAIGQCRCTPDGKHLVCDVPHEDIHVNEHAAEYLKHEFWDFMYQEFQRKQLMEEARHKEEVLKKHVHDFVHDFVTQARNGQILPFQLPH